MKKRNKIIVLVIVLGSFFICAFYGGNNFSKREKNNHSQIMLKDIFTEGEHEVSLMEIGLPKELEAKYQKITFKLKESFRKNPKWTEEYIKKYSDLDGNLPWHKNFGITEEEYNDVITADEKMEFMEKKKTIITLKEDEDGQLFIVENEDLYYLRNLKIDRENNRLNTEVGEFKHSNDFKASDAQKVTGPWDGSTWKVSFNQVSRIRGIDKTKTYGEVGISVGKLKETDEIIIYYRENIIDQGNAYKGKEILVIHK